MAGNGIFDTQNGLVGYIISTEIPVERWITTWTSDPETIRQVKLLAIDIRAIASCKGRESGPSYKNRMGVTGSSHDLNISKVFHGVAAKRLARDIKNKYAEQYKLVHRQMVCEAALRVRRYLWRDIAARTGVQCGECFLGAAEVLLAPFHQIMEEDYLEERLDAWASLGFGYREEPAPDSYFILTGITNSVRTEFELIQQKQGVVYPIVHQVCEDILNLEVWWPYPERPTTTPDRRWGWTFCHPVWNSKEVIETFTTHPAFHGFNLFSHLVSCQAPAAAAAAAAHE